MNCRLQKSGRNGYAEILREFERMSKELETSLRGNGQLESMNDF
jgi:hypothetical protein